MGMIRNWLRVSGILFCRCTVTVMHQSCPQCTATNTGQTKNQASKLMRLRTSSHVSMQRTHSTQRWHTEIQTCAHTHAHTLDWMSLLSISWNSKQGEDVGRYISAVCNQLVFCCKCWSTAPSSLSLIAPLLGLVPFTQNLHEPSFHVYLLMIWLCALAGRNFLRIVFCDEYHQTSSVSLGKYAIIVKDLEHTWQ